MVSRLIFLVLCFAEWKMQLFLCTTFFKHVFSASIFQRENISQPLRQEIHGIGHQCRNKKQFTSITETFIHYESESVEISLFTSIINVPEGSNEQHKKRTFFLWIRRIRKMKREKRLTINESHFSLWHWNQRALQHWKMKCFVIHVRFSLPQFNYATWMKTEIGFALSILIKLFHCSIFFTNIIKHILRTNQISIFFHNFNSIKWSCYSIKQIQHLRNVRFDEIYVLILFLLMTFYQYWTFF